MTSLSTDTISRRRSLSEGCSFNALAFEDDEPSEPVPNVTPLLSIQHGGLSLAALEQRSKSESFICTAQGIVFQDTQCQKYQTRLESLMQLAADASSSHSNVLLAKKALRYRKVLERRRVVV